MIIQKCDSNLSKYNQDYYIHEYIKKFLKKNKLCSSEKTFFNYIIKESPFTDITFRCNGSFCYVYEAYRIGFDFVLSRKRYSSRSEFYRIHNRNMIRIPYRYTQEERELNREKSRTKNYTNFLYDILPNTVIRYNTLFCCMLISEYIFKKYNHRLWARPALWTGYKALQENKIFKLIHEVNLFIKEIKLSAIKFEFYERCKTLEKDDIQDCYVII